MTKYSQMATTSAYKLDSLTYHIEPKGIDFSDKESVALAIGSLLYTPANKPIASKIKRFRTTSLVLDLEDSVADEELLSAETILLKTLTDLSTKTSLPMIFIRVRNPQHLQDFVSKMNEAQLNLITGFNLPKYDHLTAPGYLAVMQSLPTFKYVIPILETEPIVDPIQRHDVLKTLQALEKDFPHILAYQVGSTDFSSVLGIRRYYEQAVYDVPSLNNILGEIANAFSPNHVVIGPVNEYYNFNNNSGFIKELSLDFVNGFTGKTAIHPNQVDPIIKNLAVHISNYKDAYDIVHDLKGVGSSYNRNRMNEAKPHKKWANRILKLADIYGVYK